MLIPRWLVDISPAAEHRGHKHMLDAKGKNDKCGKDRLPRLVTLDEENPAFVPS